MTNQKFWKIFLVLMLSVVAIGIVNAAPQSTCYCSNGCTGCTPAPDYCNLYNCATGSCVHSYASHGTYCGTVARTCSPYCVGNDIWDAPNTAVDWVCDPAGDCLDIPAPICGVGSLIQNCAPNVCSGGYCVACNADPDCPSGQHCTTSHTCVNCITDTHCPSGQNCTASNTCVDCITDAGCPSGQHCTTSNTCVYCTTDAQCGTTPCPTYCGGITLYNQTTIINAQNICLGGGTCTTGNCLYNTYTCVYPTPVCSVSYRSCLSCLAPDASSCLDQTCWLKSCNTSNQCVYTPDLTPACVVVANAGPDRNICKNVETKFDGSGSTGAITDYAWKFGDLGTATGILVSHMYSSVGAKTLNLTVTNSAIPVSDDDTATITVVNPPAAGSCNYCEATITLSKNRACFGDAIIAQINGLVNCSNSNVTFKIDDTLLCESEILEDFAFCVFKTPQTFGNNLISATVTDGVNSIVTPATTPLQINERPADLGYCYDALGQKLPCENTCDDTVTNVRKWKNVSVISVPLHFSFATNSLLVSMLAPDPNAITCNSKTYRNFTYGLNCYNEGLTSGPDCSCSRCNDTAYFCLADTPDKKNLTRWLWDPFASPTDNTYKYFRCQGNYIALGCYQHQSDYSKGCSNNFCSYDTHNLSRYTYGWSFEYDMMSSVMSTHDMIPITVGNDQELFNSLAAAMTGNCEGDGSLCYTDIPICGDGVCSTRSGERCWNCEKDCGAQKDYYVDPANNEPLHTGQCSNGADWCSICPTGDDTFSDARGCVKQFKELNEQATCSEMCNPSDTDLYYADKQFGIGKNAKEQLGELDMYPGVCCNKDGDLEQKWFNGTQTGLTSECKYKKGLYLDDISVEFDAKGTCESSGCCGSSPDYYRAARINLTIVNGGAAAFTMLSSADNFFFSTNVDKDGYYSCFKEINSEGVARTLDGGGNTIISFVCKCIRTDPTQCWDYMYSDALYTPYGSVPGCTPFLQDNRPDRFGEEPLGECNAPSYVDGEDIMSSQISCDSEGCYGNVIGCSGLSDYLPGDRPNLACPNNVPALISYPDFPTGITANPIFYIRLYSGATAISDVDIVCDTFTGYCSNGVMIRKIGANPDTPICGGATYRADSKWWICGFMNLGGESDCNPFN